MSSTSKKICILAAFSLMLLVPAYAQDSPLFMPATIIDVIGVIIGVVSIAIIFNNTKTYSGDFKKSFNLIMFGITAMIIAVIYTLVFTRFKLYPIPGGVDIHHLLMFIGLIMFVTASHNIAKSNRLK